jgi:hypothetical protein
VIATVGAESIDEGLADRMPWLAANGIELRWVPSDEFARLGIYAPGLRRLHHDFQSDMVLLLDADTLIRRPLDDLIKGTSRAGVLAGTIAHTTPLTQGKLADPDWAHLFSLCGLPAPRLDYEHTGWGYFFNDPRYRYCPPYFNYGVIAGPARLLSQIGRAYAPCLERVRAAFGSYFDGQIALSMAIAQLDAPVRALPLRYNMTNNPLLEALHHQELEHAVILHLLHEHQFRRAETFASLASLEAFLNRTDLRVVSLMAQEVVRAIFPALVAEERPAVAAA